jgi:hypothetical protein
MQKFVAKHAATTTGTLSCFDRLLFKGHLPLGYPQASRGGLPRRISECSRLMRGTSLHRTENLDRETLWEPSPQSAT